MWRIHTKRLNIDEITEPHPTRLPFTWILGRMFWNGAACNRSHTSSWDCNKRWAETHVRQEWNDSSSRKCVCVCVWHGFNIIYNIICVKCLGYTRQKSVTLGVGLRWDGCVGRTRLCSLSRQKRRALPTSLRFWKHTVFNSAYSTMSFNWWWKNSRMPESKHKHW